MDIPVLYTVRNIKPSLSLGFCGQVTCYKYVDETLSVVTAENFLMDLIIINFSLSNSYLDTNYRKLRSVLYELCLHRIAVQLSDKFFSFSKGFLVTTHRQVGDYVVSSEIHRPGVSALQVYWYYTDV